MMFHQLPVLVVAQKMGPDEITGVGVGEKKDVNVLHLFWLWPFIVSSVLCFTAPLPLFGLRLFTLFWPFSFRAPATATQVWRAGRPAAYACNTAGQLTNMCGGAPGRW
jgi:hypothetical protein